MTQKLAKAVETWLYYYDPTIRLQSSEWKHPSSPTPKKAKTVKSAGRAMTINYRKRLVLRECRANNAFASKWLPIAL
ncbi:hypothetical protein TNCV_3831061 [Trichonephila clavipes]|nr:hypothetical protein TNCV_3831061 [Trichonephila clavipes]